MCYMRGHRVIGVLVSVLGVIACVGDGRDAPAEAGIPTLGITEDLRIDGYEEDLVPIQWLGVSSTGRIALLQGQDHNVRIYDPSGRVLAAVGREGEGPGEFQRLVRAGWIGGTDTLWVSDTQLDRAVVISPDLEIVRTVRNHERAEPLPADSSRFASYVQPSPYAMFEDGSSLVWAIREVPGSGPEIEGSPVLRLSPEGHIQDIVAVIVGSDGSGVMASVTGGGTVSRQVPYFPRRYWTIGPRGSSLAVLTTSMTLPEPSFQIVVVDAMGDTVFDRSYPFDPERIPPAVMDSAIVRRASTLEGALRTEIESKLRAAAPEYYPEAEELVIGADHRIWVGMRSRARGTRWLVLTATGEPEAEVVLPPGVSPRAADHEFLWCIQEDELGVESVVKYRLAIS